MVCQVRQIKLIIIIEKTQEYGIAFVDFNKTFTQSTTTNYDQHWKAWMAIVNILT